MKTTFTEMMSFEAHMSVKIRNICPSDISKSWDLFQYPISRLILRSLDVSKLQDLCLELSYRFESWQAPQQQCWQGAFQISKWWDNLKYQSHGSDTSWDLTIRRVSAYWNRAQAAKCYTIYPWSRLSYTFEADVYLRVSVLLLIEEMRFEHHQKSTDFSCPGNKLLCEQTQIFVDCFHMHFLARRNLHLISNFTEICLQGFKQQ